MSDSDPREVYLHREISALMHHVDTRLAPIERSIERITETLEKITETQTATAVHSERISHLQGEIGELKKNQGVILQKQEKVSLILGKVTFVATVIAVAAQLILAPLLVYILQGQLGL